MPKAIDGKLELLTSKNSVLALVDYQPAMFKGVASGDKTIIRNAAFCAAKAVSILGIPVVLFTINPKSNGDFISEITALFPDQEVFARKVPSFDAFEDERNWNAVKTTGREKLVISGLWTSMCFAYSALHALKEELEVYGLMDAARETPFYALFYTAIYTGLRRSELLGLRWRDIDLDLATLSVVQTLHHVPKKGYIFKEPKTKRSRRLVDLSPSLALLLREHRANQELERKLLGHILMPDDLVFCCSDGSPLPPKQRYQSFP